jgi:outer membrane lipoprotein-sorting protein
MSKFSWSGIAIAFISLIGTAQAQLPPGSKTLTSESQPAPPTSTPLKASDLPLLTRAIGKFWQTNRAETESQIEVDSSDEKGKTKYFVSVKTIAKVGQKFRSELTIDRGGKTAKIKYTIVSDGKKLYIYRPDLSQYVETNVDELYSTPFVSIIGLFSVTFTALDEARRQDLITDILGENNKIVSFETFKDILVRQQQINGKNLSTYTYDNRGNGLSISGFINPQTVMFERIEFKDKVNRIEIVEKMIKRNFQPVITDKTFTFSPPKGVKKVKSLQVGPFKF